MIAVVQIEIQNVNQEKVAAVHNEVIESFGPANPTVVVKVDRNIEDVAEDFELDMSAALTAFQQYGDIVLAR